MRKIGYVTLSVEEKRAEYDRGYREGEEYVRTHDVGGELRRLRNLKEEVEAFERVSGIKISNGWSRTERIGEAVKLISDGGHKRIVGDLVTVARKARRVMEEAEKAV